MQLYPFRHVPSNSFTGNRRSRGVRPDKQKRRVVLIEEDWSGVRGGEMVLFLVQSSEGSAHFQRERCLSATARVLRHQKGAMDIPCLPIALRVIGNSGHNTRT